MTIAFISSNSYFIDISEVKSVALLPSFSAIYKLTRWYIFLLIFKIFNNFKIDN